MLRRLARLVGAVALLAALSVGVPSTAEAGAGDPVGSWDESSIGDHGSWVLYGWAADPDGPGQGGTVHVYVDGRHVAAFATGEPRPDVERAVPYAGPNSGWRAAVEIQDRDRRVCVYVLNHDGTPGTNRLLSCQTLPLRGPSPGDPIGHLDAADAHPARIHLRGWAADPDDPNGGVFFPSSGPPIRSMHLYVDGQLALFSVNATRRPDVQRVHPFAGDHAGFEAMFAARPGRHSFCIYALNGGRTGHHNTTIGCGVLDVPGSTAQGPNAPVGSLDEVSLVYNGNYGTGGADVLVRGWAHDPDAARPLTVQIFATVGFPGPGYARSLTASTGRARPDVARAVPGAPQDTGWELLIPGGRYATPLLVCATVADRGSPSAGETVLGCRSSSS